MTGSGRQVWTALRAGFYAASFVLLWSWFAAVVRPLDRRLELSLPALLVPAGALLAVAGGSLMLACVVVFVRVGRGTPAPFDPPREFVATGPYRFVRNPMFVGALTALVGTGLALRSPSIAALALVFLVAAHLFVILHEEPSLERHFGKGYRAYKARVGRWLPRRTARGQAGELGR
jgi:protein-S-isoprenylcysteine O-methyltransferase Ste14